MQFKYIFFRKQPFCRFMLSLRENENISMWGKRITPQQKKLLPFLPGSLLESYYFKCYHKNQMVINLCTRRSVKGSYKRIKTISTNFKTSWRIKTQGFNSVLHFTIKTQTNKKNNSKTLFTNIGLIPFQTLFWPRDHSKTRKKEVFSFSYTTGLQAQEWPRYWLESKLQRITHVRL